MVTKVATGERVIEIEVDDERNRCLSFLPIRRRIRGRFDFMRVAEPLAKALTNQYPQPIPGQRLALNLDTAEACLVEPLHDSEHAAVRQRIERQHKSIPQAREVFANVDVPTWLYWMQSAVQAGIARVVTGQFPETINGKPIVSFFSNPASDPLTRFADAMEQQAAAMQKQAEMLTTLVGHLATKQ